MQRYGFNQLKQVFTDAFNSIHKSNLKNTPLTIKPKEKCILFFSNKLIKKCLLFHLI